MPRTKPLLSIDELLAQARERMSQLAKLSAKVDQLEKQLMDVRAEIKALGGDRKPSKGARKSAAAGSSGNGSRPKNKISLAEAIVAVLSKTEPKAVKDIIADVKANGYKTTSQNFETIVYQTLAKDERIEKAGRGLYKLKA